jgi:ferrous iron transport protein B
MAKESVVSVLEVLFDEAGGVSAAISTLSAASLLVFSLVYTPCVAAVAAIGREMGRRWAVAVVLWQCVVAWIAAFIVYYAGMLIGM